MSKESLKEKFATGKKPTGADFEELIDGVEGPQGVQGVGVKSIALTVDDSGDVTGGTLTLTDNSEVPITVSRATV